MAVELRDPTGPARRQAASSALGHAAMAALRAPSIFNSQPWRWRLRAESAELWADRSRQLHSVDPDGRLMTLSCGIGLDHACTALTAAGRHPVVHRLPDPDRPDLLAVVHDAGPATPDDTDRGRARSIQERHTDRRPFTGTVRIPAAYLDELRDLAERRGAHLHLVPDEDVALLTVTAAHAAERAQADPAYREELNVWTHRPARAGDGVPEETAVGPVPRRVPVRDFTAGRAGMAPGTGTDRHARYAVVFTDEDTPAAWLSAGEAVSAVLLGATSHGIATNPLSDVVETDGPRQLLKRMLSGIGYPQLALRMGLGAVDTPVPAAPRRGPDEVIDSD